MTAGPGTDIQNITSAASYSDVLYEREIFRISKEGADWELGCQPIIRVNDNFRRDISIEKVKESLSVKIYGFEIHVSPMKNYNATLKQMPFSSK